MKLLKLALVLSLASCGSSGGAGGPPATAEQCAAAAAGGAKATVAHVKKASSSLGGGASSVLEMKAEGVLAKECADNKWQAEAAKCFADATDDTEKCRDLLGDDRKSKLASAWKAVDQDIERMTRSKK